uniref:Transcription initiation factor TFIID subunit 13 n=1 Tax=Oryza punctata TaxID=4537 RepID=A0A0E0JI08_ORYPU
MQNPSGHHHASPASAAKSKSSTPAAASASGQGNSHHHHHSGGGGADASATTLKRKRGVFQKDLQHMMYGFGDDPNPLPETVALVEDIVVEYVTDLGITLVELEAKQEPAPADYFAQAECSNCDGTGRVWIKPHVHKAQNVASKRGKLLTEDFLYLIRKDVRKLHRATELLSMNEELKQARKAFDVNEETLATNNE